MADISADLQGKIARLAQEGEITCSQALQLAKEEKIPPRMVGKAANALRIKITACQLGCFGSKQR